MRLGTFHFLVGFLCNMIQNMTPAFKDNNSRDSVDLDADTVDSVNVAKRCLLPALGLKEHQYWQTGWWLKNPSEKYKLVSWDDETPNIWKNKKCSKPPTSKGRINTQWIGLRENLQESPMIFMRKSMVSCRCSLKLSMETQFPGGNMVIFVQNPGIPMNPKS